MGRRGWERREVAALAPWRDEKPSKPVEEENTGRAEVKLPRPSEREQEKEENLPNFFLPSGGLCTWSKRRPGVETLELPYRKCTFKAVANFWATCKRCSLFSSFAPGILSDVVFLFQFSQVLYKFLLYYVHCK